jgi:hypothetical protein
MCNNMQALSSDAALEQSVSHQWPPAHGPRDADGCAYVSFTHPNPHTSDLKIALSYSLGHLAMPLYIEVDRTRT